MLSARMMAAHLLQQVIGTDSLAASLRILARPGVSVSAGECTMAQSESFLSLAAAWRNDAFDLLHQTRPYGSSGKMAELTTYPTEDGRKVMAGFALPDERWSGAKALRDRVPSLELACAKVPAGLLPLALPVLAQIRAIALMDLLDMRQGGDDGFNAALVEMDTAGEMLSAAMQATAESPTVQGIASDLSVEARSLAMLAMHPDWSNKKIAEEIGCSRTSLYKSDRFKQSRSIQKAARIPRGSKSKSGHIEAIDED